MKYLKKVKLQPINPTKELLKKQLRGVPYLNPDLKVIQQEFFHPKVNTNYVFPVKDEVAEFRNTFDKHKDIKFLNESYKELLFQLKEQDDAYELTGNVNNLSEVFKLWESFIEKEYSDFMLTFDRKEEYEASMDRIGKMFNRIKLNSSNYIKSEDILKLHHEVFQDPANKGKYFTVPIHRLNLCFIIHPYWGYLCKFVSLILKFLHTIIAYEL